MSYLPQTPSSAYGSSVPPSPSATRRSASRGSIRDSISRSSAGRSTSPSKAFRVGSYGFNENPYALQPNSPKFKLYEENQQKVFMAKVREMEVREHRVRNLCVPDESKHALLTLLRETSPPKARSVTPATLVAAERIGMLEEELQKKEQALKIASAQYDAALGLIERKLNKEREEESRRTEEIKMTYETAIRGLQITHAQELESARRDLQEELERTKIRAAQELEKVTRELQGALDMAVGNHTKVSADTAALEAEIELKNASIQRLEEKLAQRELAIQQLRSETSEREQVLARCEDDIEDMQAEIGGVILELKEKGLLSEEGNRYGSSNPAASVVASALRSSFSLSPSHSPQIKGRSFSPSRSQTPTALTLIPTAPPPAAKIFEATTKHEKLRAVQRQIEELSGLITSYRSGGGESASSVPPTPMSSEGMQRALDRLTEKCRELESIVQAQIIDPNSQELSHQSSRVAQLSTENISKTQTIRDLQDELSKLTERMKQQSSVAKNIDSPTSNSVNSSVGGSVEVSTERVQQLEKELREQLLALGRSDAKVQRLEEKLAKKDGMIKSLQGAVIAHVSGQPVPILSPSILTPQHQKQQLSTPIAQVSPKLARAQTHQIRALTHILRQRTKRFKTTQSKLLSRLHFARSLLHNLQQVCAKCSQIMSELKSLAAGNPELSAKISEFQNLVERAQSVKIHSLPSVITLLTEEKAQIRSDLSLALEALTRAREKMTMTETRAQILENELKESRAGAQAFEKRVGEQLSLLQKVSKDHVQAAEARVSGLMEDLARKDLQISQMAEEYETHRSSILRESERLAEDVRQRDLALKLITTEKLEDERKIQDLLQTIQTLKTENEAAQIIAKDEKEIQVNEAKEQEHVGVSASVEQKERETQVENQQTFVAPVPTEPTIIEKLVQDPSLLQQLDSLTRECEEKTLQIESLQTALSHMQTKNENETLGSEREVQRLLGDVRNAERELQVAQQKINDLTSQLSTREEHCKALSSELEIKSEEVDDLSARLSAREQELVSALTKSRNRDSAPLTNEAPVPSEPALKIKPTEHTETVPGVKPPKPMPTTLPQQKPTPMSLAKQLLVFKVRGFESSESAEGQAVEPVTDSKDPAAEQ